MINQKTKRTFKTPSLDCTETFERNILEYSGSEAPLVVKPFSFYCRAGYSQKYFFLYPVLFGILYKVDPDLDPDLQRKWTLEP